MIKFIILTRKKTYFLEIFISNLIFGIPFIFRKNKLYFENLSIDEQCREVFQPLAYK